MKGGTGGRSLEELSFGECLNRLVVSANLTIKPIGVSQMPNTEEHWPW